jgi:DNA-binding NarL/FixJ family response regulator
MPVVGQAENGREAVELTLALDPDVVLMDVRMPVMGGLEATQLLTQREQGPRIVMFSAGCDRDVVQAARNAGAAGFLEKDSPGTDVVNAIRCAHEGLPVWPAWFEADRRPQGSTARSTRQRVVRLRRSMSVPGGDRPVPAPPSIGPPKPNPSVRTSR